MIRVTFAVRIDVERTYEEVEKGTGAEPNNWISTLGSRLDKRQCSLQICIRTEGEQPPIGLVFRGKGMRLSEEEKSLGILVSRYIFKKNAWVDTKACLGWAEKCVRAFVGKEKLERFVLFLDNLTGHQANEFKKSISEMNGIAWYGLPGATDMWHPVAPVMHCC